jgi:hypothetical protein
LDTDKDGKLSDAELETAKGRFREAMLAKRPDLDTDGDGKLSNEELEAGRGQFNRAKDRPSPERILEQHPEADTNKDGALSPQEMGAFLRSAKGGDFGVSRAGPRPGRLFDLLLEKFGDADLDKNGELSRDELLRFKEQHTPPRGKGAAARRGGPQGFRPELRARLLERFPEADTDKDGELSDEELKALKERKKQGKARGDGNRKDKADGPRKQKSAESKSGKSAPAEND